MGMGQWIANYDLIAFDPHLMYSFLPGVPETISKGTEKHLPQTSGWFLWRVGHIWLYMNSYIYIYDSIYVHFNIDLYSYILIQDWIWICPKLGKFKGIHRHFSVEHDFINRHILGIRQPQLMASAAIKTGILVGLRGHISKKQLHTFKIPSSKLT
jgi:hypothetical protein